MMSENDQKFVGAGQPDDKWTFEDLMKFGASCVTGFEGIEAQIACLAKKSAIQLFRAGRALVLAKKKRPKGKTWDKCIEECGIKGTSDWEARALFEKAGTEDAIAGLGLTEAKVKFGIVKEKVAKPSMKSNKKSKKGGADNTSSNPGIADPRYKLIAKSEDESAGGTSERNGETNDTINDSDDENHIVEESGETERQLFERFVKCVNGLRYVKGKFEANGVFDLNHEILAQVYEAQNLLESIRETCGKEAAA